MWQDTNSGDRLAADVVDGKVTRFSAEPLASIMVFQRASWWQTPAVFLPMLFGSLVVLLLTVLAWPVSALVRRHYGVRYRAVGPGCARASLDPHRLAGGAASRWAA